MSKGNIFIFSVLLLAGASGAALAQQGANGPTASVPAPIGGPVGSPTATPGATSGRIRWNFDWTHKSEQPRCLVRHD